MNCPCCNSVIVDPPTVGAIAHVRAGTHTSNVLSHLASIYPESATNEQLVDVAYGHSRLPETPTWNVRSIIKDARRKIQPYGWTIPNARGREIARYRLERIAA